MRCILYINFFEELMNKKVGLGLLAGVLAGMAQTDGRQGHSCPSVCGSQLCRQGGLGPAALFLQKPHRYTVVRCLGRPSFLLTTQEI